jgi:DtxR family Mn-dependent transcriptional regulator
MKRTVKLKIDKENLLKKIFHLEWEGKHFVPENETERKSADKLAGENLLKRQGRAFVLTEKGKAEAVAVIRKHRLYETYLARRTGVDIKDWHRLAEKGEHLIDDETLDAWEKELGYPLIDPHGDPIPDVLGKIEKIDAELLSHFRPEKPSYFIITHLEDEPEDLYHRLLDKGLYSGAIIKVMFSGSNWQIDFEGLRVLLTEEEAGLVSVKPMAAVPDEENIIRLSGLKEGEKAKIIRLSAGLYGMLRQRLLDLGFVRNAVVSVYMKAPFGEPVAYDIKGATVSLRKEQADKILVVKL